MQQLAAGGDGDAAQRRRLGAGNAGGPEAGHNALRGRLKRGVAVAAIQLEPVHLAGGGRLDLDFGLTGMWEPTQAEREVDIDGRGGVDDGDVALPDVAVGRGRELIEGEAIEHGLEDAHDEALVSGV